MSHAPGTLFLVPAPLDFGCAEQAPLDQVLPARTLEIAATLGHWVAENAKSARALLKRVDQLRPLALPIQQQAIAELPREVHKRGDHGGDFDARPLLAPLLAGHDLGLLSEAGMPAVADPGASVVRAAHLAGCAVVPLVGPSSLLLALAASGLNGQGFVFHGYLPQERQARLDRLRALDAQARQTGYSQLFIETPYRNQAVWQAALQAAGVSSWLACASGLTLPGARIQAATVQAWRGRPMPVANDTPCVFALGC